MRYELDVRTCIENGIGIISSHYCYNKERLGAFSEMVNKNGYDITETIDRFFECVSLEVDEQMSFNPTLIILDILRTPACKKRLIETIYKYNGLICHLISFFKDFKMDEEFGKISTILIENRAQYYRSFEVFMCSDFEKGIDEYYKLLDAYPDAKFFESVEKNYDSAYGYSVATELLRVCMKHLLNNSMVTKAEECFWNENNHLMVKWIPKREFAMFLSQRYMLLIPNLEFMNKEIQEIVVKRLGKRQPTRIFKDGNTRMLAYYVIGRILNGNAKLYCLMNALETQERTVDWKELLRIFSIAYEEIDSYDEYYRKCLKYVIEYAEDCIKAEEYDGSEELDDFLMMPFWE